MCDMTGQEPIAEAVAKTIFRIVPQSAHVLGGGKRFHLEEKTESVC